MKKQVYNGNDVFNVNCNLYGIEFIKPQETLEAIRDGFIFEFESKLKKVLSDIGLKYIGLECYSPREYNYLGDSIDLTIEVIDPEKYVRAIDSHREEINKRLASNKSYDGYLALTIGDVDEEIVNAQEEDFTPDVMCLSYLLNNKIDFDNDIDITDFFVYDYDCGNDDCDNEKENCDDYLCPECQAKEDEENNII